MAAPSKTYLTPADLAARWSGRVSIGTLAHWRTKHRKDGPAYTKIGGKVLYDLSDVEAYEQAGRKPAGGDK